MQIGRSCCVLPGPGSRAQPSATQQALQRSHRACPFLVTGQDPAADVGTVSVETGAVPAFSTGRAGGLAAGASGR